MIFGSASAILTAPRRRPLQYFRDDNQSPFVPRTSARITAQAQAC
jgi:hypothetical protein